MWGGWGKILYVCMCVYVFIFSIMRLKIICVLYFIFQRFLGPPTTSGIMLFVTLFNLMAFGRGLMSGRFPFWMLWGSWSSLYLCFRKLIILYIYIFSSFNFINFLCNIIFVNVFCIFVFL